MMRNVPLLRSGLRLRWGITFLCALLLAGCLDTPPTPTPVPTAAPVPSPAATAPPVPSVPPTPTVPAAPPAPPTVAGPVRSPVAGDAGAAFSAMLAAMDGVPSYRYMMVTVIGPPAAQTRLEVAGEYQAPDRYHYTLHNGLEPPLEVIALGPTIYTRQADGAWAAGSPEPTSNPLGGVSPPAALVGLLTYAGEAHTVGEEALGDGPPARRLAYTLPPVAGQSGPQGGDVWLDADGRLARLLLRFGGAEDAAGTITVDFRDYGAPLVISAPGP